MTWHIIFGISFFLLLYHYLLYPLILSLASRAKNNNTEHYTTDGEFPKASILLAVYNEEAVIKEKLENLLALKYPDGKLEILISSDASTDDTNRIIEGFAAANNIIKFRILPQRRGKVEIINSLAEKAGGRILVITDANIMHEPSSLKMLIRNFKNDSIGLVDSMLRHRGLKSSGISRQEKTYVQWETRLKQMEGLIWKSMMGPSGAFYAIRKELFSPVPKNHLVDDFYINMKVLESGAGSVCDNESLATEDVSNNWKEEFRRKMRISAGNFQNLARFSHLLLRFYKPVGFCFLSHKVLRWMGPFFLLLTLLSSIMNFDYPLFRILFYIQATLMLIPFIDSLLRKFQIHIVILRFITHFYNTNLAIFAGFFWYLKGIKSNVWQPTKRNQ